MKRILYLGLFVVAIAFTGVASYQWGARTGHERGEQYTAERSAVEFGLLLYSFAQMLEFGSDEKLKVSIVDAMWYSIIDIDNFMRRDDAAKEDLVLANNTLPRLVEYFHLNPRAIEPPVESRLAEAVTQNLKQTEPSEEDRAIDPDLHDSLIDGLGQQLEAIESFFDLHLLQLYRMDLEIQEVLNRHIAQRNFPGSERTGGGVTFLLPIGSRGGGGGRSGFTWEGGAVRVSYRDGELTVNDLYYGTLMEGDQVDLRMRDHVFVNDVERHPSTRGTER